MNKLKNKKYATINVSTYISYIHVIMDYQQKELSKQKEVADENPSGPAGQDPVGPNRVRSERTTFGRQDNTNQWPSIRL